MKWCSKHQGEAMDGEKCPQCAEESKPVPFNFEQIDDSHQRAKVFGGWLVKSFENVYHAEMTDHHSGGEGWDWRVAMAFVPDPKHEWEIEK